MEVARVWSQMGKQRAVYVVFGGLKEKRHFQAKVST